MAAPYRWMMFVDGENLTIQAQKLAEAKAVPLVEGKYWQRDVFIWAPNFQSETPFMHIQHPALHMPYPIDARAIRAHYYTTVRGSQERVIEIRRALRALVFEPEVFAKVAGKSKGVDITLARDVLSHGFRDN